MSTPFSHFGRLREQRPPLLIFGASARAAAHSAVRAGMQPICADLFSDDDLRAVAEVLPIRRYPHDFPKVAQLAPAGPWMYTGALENHPRIITAISVHRPLWGNPAEVVALARNPFRIHAILAAADLPAAAVRPHSEPPPPDGRWVLKPLQTAAGRGIRLWDETATASKTLQTPHYFQQKLSGTPISALFLATPEKTWLIGIARQFVGEKSLNAPPYGYCGSVGPIEPAPKSKREIQRTGEVLAKCCGLRGLFGGDFLYDDNTARLTEINPRYTASVEMFEHAYGIPLLDWQRRVFERSTQSDRLETDLQSTIEQLHRRGPRHIVGKVILYADRKVTTPPLDDFLSHNPPSVPPACGGEERGGNPVPYVADLPAANSVIAAGHPICSVLADGTTRADCLKTLAKRARAVSLCVFGSEAGVPLLARKQMGMKSLLLPDRLHCRLDLMLNSHHQRSNRHVGDCTG